ncbi:MAG: tRNA (adenosine(37)-N6)-threonylcarbamoyltransferase complex ATPase subunit type 1 TsaE [Acidaminococcaceae bacterium]|nr:tRNA (adenosine(37)-N6)-threonylcarbamoyltransferase complex ATPase subunit type 1 TsaE [Acidaminococcaceae bacterium]
MTIHLDNAEATENLGKQLGKLLFDGAVVLLTGDLGAGKTLLTKGVAMARGVDGTAVVSPTFTLMNIYEGDMEIRHFDLYRLESEEELDNIGFDEYCGGTGITVIEWADLFMERMPQEYILIKLLREDAGRRAEVTALGFEYEEVVEKLNVDFRN